MSTSTEIPLRSPHHYPIFAGYCAVFLVALMIIAKTYAYYYTGSTSILSSLMDSVLDSLISLTTLASLYYAKRPPDKHHRWGHGKMEAVSALFQAAIIAAGGAFVVFESVNRLTRPSVIDHTLIGLAVMAFSIVLSVILVLIQRFALNKTPSLAIEADKAHYGSDIFVNLGVIAVLLLLSSGAPLWIDPLFAFVVAVFLGNIARQIGQKAIDMLMDREMPDSERNIVISAIEAHAGVEGWHDLRMHRHGTSVIISFDIEIEAHLPLKDAHAIAKSLEQMILKHYPDSEILIHMDPTGDTHDARHRIKGVHH